MKKSERIKMLVNLQQDKERAALKLLGLAQIRYSELKAQVENLKQYRKDYEANFNLISAGGVKIAQILEYKSFIHKLDQAITGQERQLEKSREELDAKRQRWEHDHFKSNGLQKVLTSTAAQENKIELVKEQKEQDDRASRPSSQAGIKNV